MNNHFINLARKKMASVVQIFVEGQVGEDVKSILNPKIGELNQWTGSGFFIKCQYGEDIIVTNAHVVKNAKSIEIMSMLTSGETFKAKVLAIVKEQEPDIAIIKLEDGELEKFKELAVAPIPYLELRDNDNIKRGTPLKAIGYPMGMVEPNITAGEITNFISGDRFTSEKLVTDAAINPGNSGGPAIDTDGKVIGLNTSIYEEADNIGFITSSEFIKIMLKNFFEKETVNFSDLGANFQINSPELARMLKMETPKGIIINKLEKESFLDHCGLKEEDVVLKVNDIEFDRHGNAINEQLYHKTNVYDYFKLIPVGEDVTVTYLRSGEEITVTSKAIPMAKKKIESIPIIKDRIFIEAWGMIIQVLSFEIIEAFKILNSMAFYTILKYYNEDKQRLVVTHVEKGSLANSQGWAEGEVIKSVNDIEIDGLEDYIKVYEETKGNIKLKSENGVLGSFKKSKKSVEKISPEKYF